MKTVQDAMRYRNRSLLPKPAPTVSRLMHIFPHDPHDSVTALLRKTGPFDPARDTFGFANGKWGLTAEDAHILRERYSSLVEAIFALGIDSVTTALNALKMTLPVFGSVGLPAEVVTFVVDRVSAELRDKILEMVIDSFPGEYGRCGGMAFAALDFFAMGWPIKQFTDKSVQDLRDYIWNRLIDSLELNGRFFLDWVMNLKILPIISRAATVAIGTGAGQLMGGPMGAAVGALATSQSDLLGLGGPNVLLNRTRAHFETLKLRLDKEAGWPIGLIYEDSVLPIKQHQILAVGYVLNGNKPILDIWDNNDMDPTSHTVFGRRIMLDFTGDDLTVTEVPTVSTLRESIPHIKGIICEEYSFKQPPESLHFR